MVHQINAAPIIPRNFWPAPVAEVACILRYLFHRALLPFHPCRISHPLCAKGSNAPRIVYCNILNKMCDADPASGHIDRILQPGERPLYLMPTTPRRLVIADADTTQDWCFSDIS